MSQLHTSHTTHTQAALALQIRDLTVGYGKKTVLTDVHCEIPEHTVTAIIGPNGAGKTTLLKAVLDIIPRIAGEILIYGEPYALHRALTAYVPQRNSVDWDYPVSALDVVTMGLYRRIGLFRSIKKKHYAIARQALRQVGMEQYADSHIGELSGGQQQRLFIARALTQDAKVVFMDEPFAGVDAKTEQMIVQLIQLLKQRGQTTIIVHHDLQTVSRYFDRVLLLNNTVIASGATAEVFTPHNIRRCYGGSIPMFDMSSEEAHEETSHESVT